MEEKQYLRNITVLGITEEDLDNLSRQMFTKYDKDCNGFIEQNEFEIALVSLMKGMSALLPSHIKAVDASLYIENAPSVLQDIDLNNDGKLDLKEFQHFTVQMLMSVNHLEQLSSRSSTSSSLKKIKRGRADSKSQALLQRVESLMESPPGSPAGSPAGSPSASPAGSPTGSASASPSGSPRDTSGGSAYVSSDEEEGTGRVVRTCLCPSISACITPFLQPISPYISS